MGSRQKDQLFKDQRTEDLYHGLDIEELEDELANRTGLIIYQILHAESPNDLRHPPSHRLIKRASPPDRYWVWVSEKWHIEFDWKAGSPLNLILEPTKTY